VTDLTITLVGPEHLLTGICVDGHLCLELQAQQLGPLVLLFQPLSLFSVTMSCQIIVRWQTRHPPNIKVSGFRTQAKRDITMGARTEYMPLSRQANS
jgi:hypothetical protein